MEKKGVRPLILAGLLVILLYFGYSFNVLDDDHADAAGHSHNHSHSHNDDGHLHK